MPVTRHHFAFITLLLLFTAQSAFAGATTCNTVTSGNWSDMATWNCVTGSGLPEADSFVTILDTHTVTLDVDASVAALVVNPGGDLDVAASPGGLTLAWIDVQGDLSNASIDLAGDLTISTETTAPRDLMVGSVNGGFNLTLRAEGNTQVGSLGGTTPLASLSTDGGGFMTLTGNVTTAGALNVSEDVVLGGDVSLVGSSVTINGNINADAATNSRILMMDSSGFTAINGTIGTVEALGSLSTDNTSAILLSGNVTTTGTQTYNEIVSLGATLSLTGSTVTFNDSARADGGAVMFDLTVDGNAVFTTDLNRQSQRGGFSALNSITITGDVEINVPGGANIETLTFQDYQGTMTLGSDAVFSSVNNGNITFRDISGAGQNLTINTGGSTIFTDNVFGAPVIIDVASITTDSAGRTRFLFQGDYRLNSDTTPTVFNDRVDVGPSTRCQINQSGSADIIFNDAVQQISGGSKHLTVNDVSGATIFNGAVDLGQLTTNDGSGADRTVFNGGTVAVSQSSGNNGQMILNDPVEILSDTVFSETGAGSLSFNNTLDEGVAAVTSNVTINSDTGLVLGSVGNNVPLDSLTTDAGGSSTLNGDVTTSGTQTWNDAVNLASDTSLNGEVLLLNDNIDNGGFVLTLRPNNITGLSQSNGVISGSGNLVKSAVGTMTFNAQNTMTGDVIGTRGVLENGSTFTNVFPSTSLFSLTSPAVADLGDSVNSVFEVQSGQSLTGDGEFADLARTLSGSMIVPGFSPAILELETADFRTGSTLSLELNGLIAGTEHDQLELSDGSLDGGSTGGMTLDVTVGFSVSPNDQFTIINVLDVLPLTGTFNNLPEGATVTSQDGSQFTISYVGGDGNDVVLTASCIGTTTVTSNVDSGAGSLRQAVADVCPGGTVTFDSDLTIGLASEITIDKALTIDGADTNEQINGGSPGRIFNVTAAGVLILNQTILANAQSSGAGGAILNAGTLNVFDSVFSANSSTEPSLGGGAVYVANNAFTLIDGSLFIDNEAVRGGAIFIDQDVTRGISGAATITDSTLTSNGTTSIEGGAIHNRGQLISSNNTVAGNGQATTVGGGVFTSMGNTSLINTIVADNDGSEDCFINLSTENNSNSLIESGNCDAALTDDPQLQPLADNGGNTQTLALALQSPAVDTGSDALCTVSDQRGVSRPQLNACDIGAYESETLGILRVNQNVTRVGPPCVQGSCWENPFLNLQDALAVVAPGAEIWVAQGTYYPDDGGTAIADEPDESFSLSEQVGVYGGFAGLEDTRDQRNSATNVTILSGDITQDDLNADGNNIAEAVGDIQGTNAFNILTVEGSGNTVLDGFTVTAGAAFGGGPSGFRRGAGINCLSESSTTNVFSNNIWIGNHAEIAAGAMSECNSTIVDSMFIANRSDGFGGAVFVSDNASLVNVSFINNVAVTDSGAIRVGGNTVIDRTVFSGNQAGTGGGAIVATSGLTVSNSLFLGNSAVESGGAIEARQTTNLTNVTLTGNVSSQLGGAISFDNGPIRLGDNLNTRNSIIWNNQDSSGVGTISAGVDVVAGAASFENTLFQGSGGSANWDPTAGIDGGGNIDDDPLFQQDVDLGAVPTTSGDAHLMDISPALDAGNNALVNGTQDLDGRARIIDGTVDMGAYEGRDFLFGDGFEDQP